MNYHTLPRIRLDTELDQNEVLENCDGDSPGTEEYIMRPRDSGSVITALAAHQETFFFCALANAMCWHK